jgi:hypothetical protein
MKLPRNEPAPIAREGSRPRDQFLPKPSTSCNRGRKYTFGLRHVLAARGDARPPRIAPAPRIGAAFRTYPT